jgi:hypothetical protein
LTNWVEYTPLSYFYDNKAPDKNLKWEQVNSCAVCMCELFEETEENLKLPEDSRYEDLEKKIFLA